jgi:hypothetical protein
MRRPPNDSIDPAADETSGPTHGHGHNSHGILALTTAAASAPAVPSGFHARIVRARPSRALEVLPEDVGERYLG